MTFVVWVYYIVHTNKNSFITFKHKYQGIIKYALGRVAVAVSITLLWSPSAPGDGGVAGVARPQPISRGHIH